MQRAAMINPLIDEITEALISMGGAAHRNVVIDQLALQRGGNPASEAFRKEVIKAFELHLEGATLRGEPTNLRLPVGQGSHRWGLTLDAHAEFRGVWRRQAD